MKKQLTIPQLKKQYEEVCNQYITKFVKKQELDFDGWVGDEVGGIASFSTQYFFNLSDIILDLNTKQPKGLILEWQNNGVENALNTPFSETINYKSYTMGLRNKDLITQKSA